MTLKISGEGQLAFDSLLNRQKLNLREFVENNTLEKLRQLLEDDRTQGNDQLIEKYPVVVEKCQISNTNVVNIQPIKEINEKKIIVHIHGGAFVFFTAESSFGVTVPLANELNIKVISINYTLAPGQKYGDIVRQVVQIVGKVIERGHRPEDIVLIGESAGGALAVAAAHSLLYSPERVRVGAVVVYSPWMDWRCVDESFVSAQVEDPILCKKDNLEVAAALVIEKGYTVDDYPFYPISLEYTKEFPPVLIQAGTREILRDQANGFHRRLVEKGAVAEIEWYEGMWHVFQGSHPHLPESVAARQSVKRFVYKHLQL